MGLDILHVKPIKDIRALNVDYFTLDELNDPEFIEQNKEFISLVEDDSGMPIQVIYFIEFGYQRKGMAAEFTIEFENCKPYLKLEFVKKAFLFIQNEDVLQEQFLKDDFQKYFIDTFVEGNSIFFASW